MKWIDTENNNQVNAFSIKFWEKLHSDLKNGQFWTEKIKECRNDYILRLTIAIDKLPLPAAFRESVLSLRAIIRQKRKLKEPIDRELKLLYWLAAIDSFSIPYSYFLRQPGYNVVESIPGKIIKSLPFSYNNLGYNKLNLLNKTDIKWIVELWGEPQAHSTLNEIHNDTWHKYEIILLEKQKKEDEAFFAKLRKC